ncbi:MAG: glycosyltransferase [Nitrososphaerota archaeon]|jgi:glycosyltransferase involved in cell wall biosynthesis|uniref:glycosyltransferase n=1 Tax=Candidatus Bathycorpusculum sp. TaxID=2994959 RepID=UPI00282C9E65|nr:glycosyltransferase [Candidatus Termitimicrobium sp.]MCL2430974.1 glycosyltransferase [Candidatus Termitimicrobium sp.]MDR0493682.1 glycosyltransferase [Nitrososphaerota archaeon]
MSQVELSFVVPAYNEENFIEGTLGTIDTVAMKKCSSYEIVVVNDGSADKTLVNARKYAVKNNHVKIISYSKNLGKGHAVKTGFMNTKGNVVFFTDSDMEIDLEKIHDYVNALKKADIVIASKKHKQSYVEVPLSRRILSECFNALVRIFTGVPLKDTQSGLKAMKKSAFINIIPRLAVKRYAFDVELLAVANLYGLKVVEMPVDIKLEAKFKPTEMWHMFMDLLGIAYRLRIIHWYQRPVQTKNGFKKHVSIYP